MWRMMTPRTKITWLVTVGSKWLRAGFVVMAKRIILVIAQSHSTPFVLILLPRLPLSQREIKKKNQLPHPMRSD